MKRVLAALPAIVLAMLAPVQSADASVTLGDENFLRSAWHDLHGRCVGIITNQTGVTSQHETIVDAIRANPAICIKAIYAPEHGLRGDRPAGEFVPSYTDERTGLPVYSLYGSQRKPNAEMLRGIDVLLFDIQDVGARPYTYVSTMASAMEAARDLGKEIWVLDRPNPIGGAAVEGPVLDPRFKSFIGLYPIAMRHGMTVGELARMFNDAFGIHAKLRVIAMSGWRRSMLWPDTGLPWVQTSPNVPFWTTTIVYPCTGLIDNAGVNNGVGTTVPFGYAGASQLDAESFATRLNAAHLPGVRFRAATWTPQAGFWKNKQLAGAALIVDNPRIFTPVRTSVEILTAVRDIAPQLLKINANGLDREWGTDSLRLGLTSGLSASAIVAKWNADTRRFLALRAKYLLYR